MSKIDWIATSISTIFAVIISSFTAYKISNKTLRHQKRSVIESRISELIKIAIEYPYLEDDTFCSNWDRSSEIAKSVEGLRYDNYCCYLFNLIEEIWIFCNGDESNINEILRIRELAKRHNPWWSADPDNIFGYSNPNFKKYIERMSS